ncbi:BTB/POZ domain-containing protein [Zalerion maritima]|uniref:BTB/POZ domain-containing protein n=1 Tax=Zalerion maritima TaxID=339359 RepID=A0AAD5WP33_9PEZI|nr:BTB/POZ domain-containing protein [Zalerion maritima]
MLSFMYNFHYDGSPSRSAEPNLRPGTSINNIAPLTLTTARPPPLLFEAKVCSLAEMYSIPALKSHSLSRFSTLLDLHWHSSQLSPAILEVYESTPEHGTGLRSLLASKCMSNFSTLSKRDDCK